MDTLTPQTEDLYYQENFRAYNFLSSQAAALFEANIIRSDLAGTIKNELAFLQSVKKKSIISEMISKNTSLGRILQDQFGYPRLCMSLLYDSLKPQMTDLIKTLSFFGVELLDDAKRSFNGSFSWQSKYASSDLHLYSEAIVDTSCYLQDLVNQLNLLYKNLNQYIPRELLDSSDLIKQADQKSQQALQFDTVNEMLIVDVGCHVQLQNYQATTKSLLVILESIASQTNDHGLKNQLDLYENQLGPIGESIQLFQKTTYKSPSDIIAFDTWRIKLTEQIQSLHQTTKELTNGLLQALRKKHPVNSREPLLNHLNVQRTLLFNLVKKDTPPKEASKILHQLMTYCQENQVEPTNLLAEELSRISPLLDKESLEFMVRLQNPNFPKEKTQVKEKVWAKLQILRKSFQTSLAAIATVCAVTTSSSCGIKKKPISEVVTEKRKIPFHEKAPVKAPKELETKKP